MMLQPNEYNILYSIVEKALADSSTALSAMTVGGIELRNPRLQSVCLTEVPSVAGGPAVVVAAVYLGIQGDLSGHIMLLFRSDSACLVVDMLLDLPAGTTRELDDLGVSGLAEMGNVVGTSFLNALSDRTGLRIIPTIPAVVRDMAGAILQTVVTDLYMNGDEVLMVETTFNEKVSGHFLLMPDQDSMARLVATLEAIE